MTEEIYKRYDNNGNIILSKYNEQGKLVSSISEDHTHKKFAYDGNGNCILEETILYKGLPNQIMFLEHWVYDEQNRLISYIDGMKTYMESYVYVDERNGYIYKNTNGLHYSVFDGEMTVLNDER